VPPLTGLVETVGKPPAAANPPAYRTRILLAEDQKLNQKLAMDFLQKLGYSVTLPADGAQAVAPVGNSVTR
jgi:PleD family two-component response regulator